MLDLLKSTKVRVGVLVAVLVAVVAFTMHHGSSAVKVDAPSSAATPSTDVAPAQGQ